MNHEHEQGWDAGVADAKIAVPQYNPLRMVGGEYVHGTDWRDGYALGFSAWRGAQPIGPLERYLETEVAA